MSFTFQYQAYAEWMRERQAIEPDWDPTDESNAETIIELVHNAQQSGVITFDTMPGLTGQIDFCFANDTDGGAYIWLLRLCRDAEVDLPALAGSPIPQGKLPPLQLASPWEEQRKVVRRGIKGRQAASSILREGVDAGNQLLHNLAAWLLAEHTTKGMI